MLQPKSKNGLFLGVSQFFTKVPQRLLESFLNHFVCFSKFSWGIRINKQNNISKFDI